MGIKFSCGDSARDVTALDIRGRQQQQHCSSVRRHDLSLGGEEAATGETPSGGGVFSPLVCDVISVHQCRHVGVCTTPGSSCRLAWDTDAQCLLVLHTGTDTPARGTVRLCARTAASSRSIMGATSAIVLVFVGCCTNVVFLELLVKEEPGSGNIITCAQFVFIALYGFLFTTQLGTKKNVVPIRDYMVLVVLFFVVNVCNNLAFAFKISMPLHMIFRSGGLIANMVMAVVVLGRRYSPSKCLSVGMITLGTLVCTYASAQTLYEGGGGGSSDGGSGEDSGVVVPSLMTWLGGIALLTFALFLSARMGIFQECLYARYGKHPWEALFYIHALSLPGFLLTVGSIADHAQRFTSSTPLPSLASVPVLSAIPHMWLYLLGNTLTQFVCISSVFRLTSECTSLTVTLVLTLRKFLSLLFSIAYFCNPFTVTHWLGTALVFGGTLVFSEVPDKLREAVAPSPPVAATTTTTTKKTD
ncbi:UDP-xylose and UDP-N-acetylglucosamine transporter-like isoform X1 [Portunus trituberculatus]|uniref:UDP-xylose and UDP-N-acetylglucosamine transporter-like isoform X1 n=2 Tax=Portunus trituberculatus TaxID=210409 RepID=UPI001E1CF42F|nr:UDP-xylose and UDP-N-acetylglucosamine transporter-like isoform X1 [Portunus trituberculatus]XP_045123449.1 UDP-xylose and UDP-N-acetylglucosamine transporter-like isoform X1 [Portunus trituberculatus]